MNILGGFPTEKIKLHKKTGEEIDNIDALIDALVVRERNRCFICSGHEC